MPQQLVPSASFPPTCWSRDCREGDVWMGSQKGRYRIRGGVGVEKIRLEGPAGWSWLCMGHRPWIQPGNDF